MKKSFFEHKFLKPQFVLKDKHPLFSKCINVYQLLQFEVKQPGKDLQDAISPKSFCEVITTQSLEDAAKRLKVSSEMLLFWLQESGINDIEQLKITDNDLFEHIAKKVYFLHLTYLQIIQEDNLINQGPDNEASWDDISINIPFYSQWD